MGAKNFSAPTLQRSLRVLRWRCPSQTLADVSDSFYYFSCFGAGDREEEPEAKRGFLVFGHREGWGGCTGAGRVFVGRGGG